MEAQEDGNRPHPREIAQWREEARDDLFQKWTERLEIPGTSQELVVAVRPILRQWVECRHGVLTYHLAQMLTGHGCFGKYLCQVVGREPTTTCHHCARGVTDTVQHTREECPAWVELRTTMSDKIGQDLSLPAIINSMVESEEAWNAVATFSEKVMLLKEAAERERENDLNSQTIRRKRYGRRRLAYMAQMPP